MILFRLFLILDAFLMSLPYPWRKGLFTSLAALAHKIASQRNRIIQQNLSFAFKNELSHDEKREIESYCYRNLALNLLQTMENRRNSAEDIAKVVTFKNREKVDAILAQGSGIIFVSAHFGNWELGGAALSSLITPLSSIYKGFSRSEFDSYLLEARSRHKMALAEKKGALKHMAKTLKNNGSVLLMIDQGSNPQYGVSADFFGYPAYHSSTAAHLSSKFNTPIVGVYITSEDEKNYTVAFEDPIDVEGVNEEAIVAATGEQIDALERLIRAHPKLWFWCHKRWKGEYKEIYSA
ncbi:MAG: lipid A biosynthesis lauroyl acyltransferase [Sulfuricurvum sp.]|uniref:lipid A biosynthesis lauroyl acyltransferase n=1 Tax=Sulfuricurvum sp. TaxID=2025608 RepID=UPI002733921D|nr:lipid A biosynthesis lauroyl acyltransferase [Sulfuricurvum sp.]MDP2851445.1 lipid A biosynthesis lauroyl acyltransferase [Sulfuricurvum sp.]